MWALKEHGVLRSRKCAPPQGEMHLLDACFVGAHICWLMCMSDLLGNSNGGAERDRGTGEASF
jgi:hypothetical protein